jgi:hypothetical protein
MYLLGLIFYLEDGGNMYSETPETSTAIYHIISQNIVLSAVIPVRFSRVTEINTNLCTVLIPMRGCVLLRGKLELLSNNVFQLYCDTVSSCKGKGKTIPVTGREDQ